MRRALSTLAVASIVFCSRSIRCDDCLANQNDSGTLYIRQLQEAVDTAVCELVNNTRYKDYTPTDDEEFDFIIVGAGSAGSVLANRLSENPSWRVLLLEAGGDPPLTSEIPYLSGTMWNKEWDWKYNSEPEPTNCLGSRGKRCFYPYGKVLGGSSSLNGMFYLRGHPEDFDQWERMGNPGWGFKNVLPYFKKSEDLRVKQVLNDPNLLKYHGVGGLLKVESFQYDLQTFEPISAGFEELGYKKFVDLNSQFSEGLFPIQMTMENSTRCSAAKAFLLGFQSRPNLKISKHSLVQKILIDKNNTAYGVSFLKNGKFTQVNASKEVILSAGAINSPQLLMISGVGPQEDLQTLRLDVRQNLKVGYNLQDQPFFVGFPVALDIALSPSPDQIKKSFQFLTDRKLFFTFAQMGNLAFITTSQASIRNVQFYFIYTNSSFEDLTNLFYSLGFNENIKLFINSYSSIKSFLFLIPVLLKPKSRGRIVLESTNFNVHPLIYPGYFNTDEDLQVLLESIDFMNALIKTKPFVELKAQVHRVDIPDCRNFEFQSEEYWRCSIKYLSSSSYHLVGTCKMGPRNYEDSVVAPDLRVIGISKLRVVDASVMPTVPSGNTNAPTIAVAEKGADLIKQSWT